MYMKVRWAVAAFSLAIMSQSATATQSKVAHSLSANTSDSAVDPVRLKLAREMVALQGPPGISGSISASIFAVMGELKAKGYLQDKRTSDLIMEEELSQLRYLVNQSAEAAAQNRAVIFSEAELHDYIRFFSSPSGKSLIRKLPEANTYMLMSLLPVFEAVQAEAIEHICSKVDCPADMRKILAKSFTAGPGPVGVGAIMDGLPN
jgi:hypothetical protein